MEAYRCTNANHGTFNHECGKPAVWIGTHASGHRQYFCLDCKDNGDEARSVKTWEAFDNPYGAHLPIFPTFFPTPGNSLTEDRIERTVERLVDKADAAFIAGKATQAQYDRWNVALNAWIRAIYETHKVAA